MVQEVKEEVYLYYLKILLKENSSMKLLKMNCQKIFFIFNISFMIFPNENPNNVEIHFNLCYEFNNKITNYLNKL
jgi:hypothetical protein